MVRKPRKRKEQDSSREITATFGVDMVKILISKETQTCPYHPHVWTAINSILSWRSGDIVVGKLRRGKKGVDSISHWADFGQLTLFYTYFGRYTPHHYLNFSLTYQFLKSFQKRSLKNE